MAISESDIRAYFNGAPEHDIEFAVSLFELLRQYTTQPVQPEVAIEALFKAVINIGYGSAGAKLVDNIEAANKLETSLTNVMVRHLARLDVRMSDPVTAEALDIAHKHFNVTIATVQTALFNVYTFDTPKGFSVWRDVHQVKTIGDLYALIDFVLELEEGAL